jgi:hypothetical protein
MESNDDDKDEHFEGDDGIMEFDGLRSTLISLWVPS